MIRVLIVDDHAVVRRGLRQIVSEHADMEVAGEVGQASDVLPFVEREPVDVVVLDINLGPASGLDVLAQLRKEKPSCAVIILTMYSEDQYAVRAIKAGAAGFVSKDSAAEKLVEAIRKVASGGRYVSAELAEKLAFLVSAKKNGAPHEALSNRELQILELIGSGKTVGEIARLLFLSVKTVSTHRGHILAKMGMKTNAELTVYAIKAGLAG